MTTMPHEMTKKLIISATGQKLIGGGKTLSISVLRKQSFRFAKPVFEGFFTLISLFSDVFCLFSGIKCPILVRIHTWI